MLNISHALSIDYIRISYPQTIELHDLGNGAHHRLSVSMYENGNAWIPPDDCGYLLTWTKGTGAAGKCELTATREKHTVTFEIPRAALLGCPGVSLCLQLVQGEKILSSFPFRLYVHQQLQYRLQEKSVEMTALKPFYVGPDEPYEGLSGVMVNPTIPLQEKTVVRSNERQEITPDIDYYGLSKVVIDPIKICEPCAILKSARTIDHTGRWVYKYTLTCTIYGITKDLIKEVAIGYSTSVSTISEYLPCSVVNQGLCTNTSTMKFGVDTTVFHYGQARITYVDLDGNEHTIFSNTA